MRTGEVIHSLLTREHLLALRLVVCIQAQVCSADPVSAAPLLPMGPFGCKGQQRKRRKQVSSNSGSLGRGSLSVGLWNLPKGRLRRGLRVPLPESHPCFSANTAPHRIHGRSWCWFLTLHHQSKCRSSYLVSSPKFQGRAVGGIQACRGGQLGVTVLAEEDSWG